MDKFDSDARRRRYEALGHEVCREYVKVAFDPHLVTSSGMKADGIARWSGYGYYEILLQEGLPLDREAETAAHEIMHIRMKHVPQIAPRFLKNIAASIANGTIKESKAESRREEDHADFLGYIAVSVWRTVGKISW